MASHLKLTQADVTMLASKLVNQLKNIRLVDREVIRIYGIPRGGIPVTYLVAALAGANVFIVDDPELADVFIDDIIDSGATMQKYCDQYPGRAFFALIDKTTDELHEKFRKMWIIFPWEGDSESSIEDNVRRMLQFTGDDAGREGLLETPHRVAKAYRHWFSGYNVDIPGIFKVFEDGGENYDEMVIVRNIPIYSKCEHHLADIFGTATIAYIPDGAVAGLSKLSRVADAFARRLQVQERLTVQIADAIQTYLKPKGVGVIITARHMCMESRGICQQGHDTVTSALRGVLKSDAAARAEFFHLASKPK